MTACGLNQRILHVDLSRHTLTSEHVPASLFRHYGGGSGLGLYYLLRMMPPRIDPLAPEAVMTIMLSPTTGAPISGQSRLSINAKSPVSRAIGDAQVGGFFPAQLKFAGFDGLVIRGRSEQPVYLYLADGQAELRDAAALWGKTTLAVEQQLKAELKDPQLEVLQVGPAGERGVRFAAVMTMASRAAGRTGMGAVMGSKHLKAIVAKGRADRVSFYDPAGLRALASWGAKNLATNPDMAGLAEHGTAGVLSYQHAIGSLPTRNYSEGQFEHFNNLAGETMTEEILKGRDTCYACVVRCKRVVEAQGAYPLNPAYGGPEYESLATLGSYCGIGNLQAVAYGNELCNAYGLDTIACGAVIAWAMECYQHGLLTEADTGGLALRFGDEAAMLTLIRQIGEASTPFGRLLGLGSQGAADALGRGHEFLITVKGQDAPAHMPQAKRSLALIYAVNPFGADHQSSEHDPFYEPGAAPEALAKLRQIGLPTDELPPQYSLDERKIRFALETEKTYSALDSLALCQFVYGPAWTLYGPEQLAEMVRAVTGWDDFTAAELQTIGARRLTLMRLFNYREGFGRADDRLPKKFYQALKGSGPTAGMALSEEALERAKDRYYALAGLTPEGAPTAAGLVHLGLAEFAPLLDTPASPR